MIIASSLLHEIKEPSLFLKKIYSVCSLDTLIHINVPNAKSFHRELAKEMGYIKNVFEKSQRNNLLNQYTNFDIEKLIILAQNENFDIEEKGGYFIKPFTHKQMFDVVNVLDNKILDGLYEMGIKFPELASEIYVNLRIKSNK